MRKRSSWKASRSSSFSFLRPKAATSTLQTLPAQGAQQVKLRRGSRGAGRTCSRRRACACP
jgi:hypothetical protein